MRRAVIASLFALSLVPACGHAWGVTGHAIVADIAEHHLTPAALDQVHALLKDEGLEHLDQIGSWPDTIRKERPEANPWHYVAIPLSETSYVPDRDCKKDDCVIEAIRRFTAILSDRSQPTQARREALKFLVHFVGDLHQPLHGADNAGDHEGNDVRVSYFGDTGTAHYPLDLHWVWDTKILERQLHVREQGASEPNLEAKRAAAIAANDIDHAHLKGLDAASNTDPAVWAMESHDAAKAFVYPGVVAMGAQAPAQPILLGAAYHKRAWPVTEVRLELGGLRLAALVNKALESHT
jgi:hypothetical protein